MNWPFLLFYKIWPLDQKKRDKFHSAILAKLTTTNQLKALHRKPTTKNVTKPVFQVAPHDRPKNMPLSPHSPFFIKLAVTNAEGKPRPGMESTLRQCQHFVDMLYGLIEETIDKKVTELSILDMECGKGYLTFALHAHLSDNYDRVNSYGVEMRGELVQEINGSALEFQGHHLKP